MKHTLLKLLLFCVLVGIGQEVVYRLKPRDQSAWMVRELKLALAQGQEIVFLGDSVMVSCDRSDTNRLPVPAVLRSLLPEMSVAQISRGGADLYLFRDICNYIVRSRHPVRAVIVEINMAGIVEFKDYMSLKPVSADLYRDQHRWFDVFYRPLQVFKLPWLQPDISREAYYEQMIYVTNTPMGRMRDWDADPASFHRWSEANMRKKITLRYLTSISDRNPYVGALREMADVLPRHGIRPVFYFTPMNRDLCAGSMPAFTPIMAGKVARVKSVLDAKNVPVLDLSFALGAEHFQGTPYPNEHLKDSGRQYVAEQLAAFVRKHVASVAADNDAQ